MPILKREVIKMANPIDSLPFDLDDELLNPFLIQLAMNGDPNPAAIKEDDHPASFHSSGRKRSGRKP